MSATKIDWAKVTQMLDNGWRVKLFRGGMESYVVIARHRGMRKMPLISSMIDDDGDLVTDDFTPEQALTRMAYKVHGEII